MFCTIFFFLLKRHLDSMIILLLFCWHTHNIDYELNNYNCYININNENGLFLFKNRLISWNINRFYSRMKYKSIWVDNKVCHIAWTSPWLYIFIFFREKDWIMENIKWNIIEPKELRWGRERYSTQTYSNSDLFRKLDFWSMLEYLYTTLSFEVYSPIKTNKIT